MAEASRASEIQAEAGYAVVLPPDGNGSHNTVASRQQYSKGIKDLKFHQAKEGRREKKTVMNEYTRIATGIATSLNDYS